MHTAGKLFFGCIICLATINSMVAVGKNHEDGNYWTGLQARTSALQSELKGAKTNAPGWDELTRLNESSGNYKQAETYLTAQWNSSRALSKASSYEPFRDKALKLANVKIEEGAFEQAAFCYRELLEVDSVEKDRSLRARDLCNLGLALHLQMNIEPSEVRRKGLGKESMAAYDDAEKIYQTLSRKADLYTIRVNKYELLEDSGDIAGAKAVFAEIRSSDMDSQNSRRQLLLHQS